MYALGYSKKEREREREKRERERGEKRDKKGKERERLKGKRETIIIAAWPARVDHARDLAAGTRRAPGLRSRNNRLELTRLLRVDEIGGREISTFTGLREKNPRKILPGSWNPFFPLL